MAERVGEWLWRRPDWLKVFKEMGRLEVGREEWRGRRVSAGEGMRSRPKWRAGFRRKSQASLEGQERESWYPQHRAPCSLGQALIFPGKVTRKAICRSYRSVAQKLKRVEQVWWLSQEGEQTSSVFWSLRLRLVVALR